MSEKVSETVTSDSLGSDPYCYVKSYSSISFAYNIQVFSPHSKHLNSKVYFYLILYHLGKWQSTVHVVDAH